jgi:hypothetical protein
MISAFRSSTAISSGVATGLFFLRRDVEGILEEVELASLESPSYRKMDVSQGSGADGLSEPEA